MHRAPPPAAAFATSVLRLMYTLLSPLSRACVHCVYDCALCVCHQVLDTLHTEGLDIVEARVDVKGGNVDAEHTDSDVFIVRPRGRQKDFDDEKLHDIKHHLMGMLGQAGGDISFQPLPRDEETSQPTRRFSRIPGKELPDGAHEAVHTALESLEEGSLAPTGGSFVSNGGSKGNGLLSGVFAQPAAQVLPAAKSEAAKSEPLEIEEIENGPVAS